MRPRDLAYDDEGVLRAPLRVVVFLVAIVVALVVVHNVGYPLVAGTAWFVARVRLELESWLLLAALLLAHLAAFRIAGGSWAEVGVSERAARPTLLAEWFVLGGAAVALPAALLVAAGWLRPEPAAEGSSLLAALRLLVVLAPAALWEELLFRGYPFAVLRRAWGEGGAVVATSLAFGLLHLQNSGANLQAVGQVVFAGVWLGGVRLATGSLFAAWTAHLGWNWAMAAVLHTPVSGLGFVVPDYKLVDAGPDWATGGAWGPEAGLGATRGMAAALTYLIARHRREERRA